MLVSCSFFFLYEWVRNLFASVDGRDDNQKGAACDDETELAIPDVAVLVYTGSDVFAWRQRRGTYQSMLP